MIRKIVNERTNTAAGAAGVLLHAKTYLGVNGLFGEFKPSK